MAYRDHDSRRKFGVETGSFTGDRIVDLTKLPPGAQAALRERILGEKPAPILSATRRLDRAGFLLLFVLGVWAAYMLSQDHLGDLAGPSQLEPRWVLPYAVLGALAFLGLGAFVRSVVREGAFRFPQGTLLYPLDLLVIDGKRMRVRSFGDARYVDAKGSSLEIEWANGDKQRVSGRRHAKASLLVEMLAAQHDLEDATAAGKSAKDVLAELRAHFPWSELAPSTPEPGRRLVLVASIVGLGAAIGAGAWAGHLRLEDDALFESALAKNDVAAYHAYLAQGKRHRAEAHDDEADAARRAIARDDLVHLTRMVAAYPGTPAVARAEQQIRDGCTRYAADFDRDRCEARLDPAAVCVQREEETICADEVRERDLDHLVHSRNLRDLFVERDLAARDGRTTRMTEMDAHIETLIQEANAEICAVDAPEAEIRALHDLARKERRIPLLAVRFEGDTGTAIRSTLRDLHDDALDVHFDAASLSKADRVWVFKITKQSLEWVSGATTSRAAIVPTPLARYEEEFIPGLLSHIHALERLGFRPNGPGPKRCVLPPYFMKPRTPSDHTGEPMGHPSPVPTAVFGGG